MNRRKVVFEHFFTTRIQIFLNTRLNYYKFYFYVFRLIVRSILRPPNVTLLTVYCSYSQFKDNSQF